MPAEELVHTNVVPPRSKIFVHPSSYIMSTQGYAQDYDATWGGVPVACFTGVTPRNDAINEGQASGMSPGAAPQAVSPTIVVAQGYPQQLAFNSLSLQQQMNLTQRVNRGPGTQVGMESKTPGSRAVRDARVLAHPKAPQTRPGLLMPCSWG